MSDKDQYLSVSQAAELLPVGTRTVYHLIERGYLRAFKLGGKILVLREDVLNAIKPIRLQE